MKLRLKLPSDKNLMLPDSFTPQGQKENQLDELIDRCNSVQHLSPITSELLKSKPKLALSSDAFPQESIFSKSLKFKMDKEKVKQNIKNYVENQYSEKLQRLKSVIKNEEANAYELLTPEDVQNKDAARFFSLNKRNFGTVEEIKEIKYEKPFKPKRTSQRVNPVETVLSSIQSMMKPEIKREVEVDRGKFCTSDELINCVKQKSPKNRIIEHELLKLWPKFDEERTKERKLLNMKIQKLVAKKQNLHSLKPDLHPVTRSRYLSN